jgi:formyltetrahydrofolate-dependent phosphoribosylglycinamide formyltransferase
VKIAGACDGFFQTFAAMFEKLQQKWKVSGTRLALILFTFAIGGSLTGYVGRKLMPLLGIGPQWLWIVVYIILVTLIWPMAVLLISIPFGQFRFFSNYLRKIGKRLGLGRGAVDNLAGNNSAATIRIAIFASGTGTNAEKIIDYLNNNPQKPAIEVVLIVSNNAKAGVLQLAERRNLPVLLLEKIRFSNGNGYAPELKKAGIRFIVLAGFLWKLPAALVKEFPEAIVNIHPALLPAYGGKGMYGRHVHETVLANKEKETGITIHYVDELYDHGNILFQAHCPVLETDTPDSLAQRVQELEHTHYPLVIASLLEKKGAFL